MGNWFRRIRATLFMGVLWALAWGIVGGGIMELIFDPHGKILDMWPQALAIPGFLGGMFFSALLAVAERKRKFEELSLGRFAILGAATGGALGFAVLQLGAVGSAPPLFRLAMIVAPFAVISAASATGTLALARRAEQGALPSGDPD